METASRNESNLREKVFELARAGEPIPDEIVSLRTGARRELAAALRAAPPEEAHRTLNEEIEDVAEQLQKCEEGAYGDQAAGFRRGVELGDRLRWLLWLGDIISEEPTVDPLALLEGELYRTEAHGKSIARLDSRLEEAARSVENQSRRERLTLLRCRLKRFLRTPAPATAAGSLEESSSAWLSVTESFQVEFRAIAEGLGANSAAPSLQPLEERREQCLQACRDQLALCEAGGVAEFLRAAASDLLEQSSERLSEGLMSEPQAHIATVRLLRAQVDCLRGVLGRWESELQRRGVLSKEQRSKVREQLRALARVRRRALNREVEARVHSRLVGIFGSSRVRLFENFILVLIFALLALVVAEWRLSSDLVRIASWFGEPSFALQVFAGLVACNTVYYFNIADLILCSFFQLDFVVRWALASWGGRYFLRHFFLESLPAFPFGFLVTNLGLMGEARFIILARILRFRSVLRLRGLILVTLRLFRVIVFFLRGMDHTVERLRPLIDRDVVVFDPNPLGEDPESPLRRRALTLENRRRRYLRNSLSQVAWDERAPLLRTQALALGAEVRLLSELDLPYRRGIGEGKGDVHLERIIHYFMDCDVTRAVSMIGRDGVERMARWLRFFDFPGFRSLPFIRRLVPAGRMVNPAEAVSLAANEVGRVLQEILGGLRFWGDLSGITTGPQILDRVGTAIVTASKRPALRLLIFGSLFLMAAALVTPFPALDAVSRFLERFVGVPILVLGGVCFVFLMIGRWLKRIAGEALDLYMRTADSQYYPLLKARKVFSMRQHLNELHHRVLRPECRLRGANVVTDEEWIDFLEEPLRVRGKFMPRAEPPDDARLNPFADDREAIVLLYRDFLDGAVLHRSDDKTSVQLLGNLAVQDIRSQTLGFGAKELRKLERLDLEKARILTFGPQVWFRFITESLCIETAKLIMEYNTTCIPSSELHLATPKARQRFEQFLAEHRGEADVSLRRRAGRRQFFGEPLTTSTFTAFDFLGPTAQSDAVVRDRYGPEVLQALTRDRRGVIRDIFGTRPYHLLPRNERVFNPYRLYRRYVGGGRIFLLPLVVAFRCVRLLARGVWKVMEIVQEVLGKKRVLRSHLSRIAGFDVAVRKINRMRKPFFIEALRLRAAVDVDYLGLRLPGQERIDATETFRDDLNFVGALESERRPLEELRNRALRDLRTFRLFLAQKGWLGDGLDEFIGRLDPSGELLGHRGEVVRALVTAYITDHGGLRSILTAPQWVREFLEASQEEGSLSFGERVEKVLFGGVFFFLPRRRRRKRLLAEYFRTDPDVSCFPRRARARALWKFMRAGEDAERMFRLALKNLKHDEIAGEDAILSALQRAAREHSLWTRKVITVRTIQALTVLDIKSYHDMVWQVGGYEDEERAAGSVIVDPERMAAAPASTDRKGVG